MGKGVSQKVLFLLVFLIIAVVFFSSYYSPTGQITRSTSRLASPIAEVRAVNPSTITSGGEYRPNSQPTCPYAIGFCSGGYPNYKKQEYIVGFDVGGTRVFKADPDPPYYDVAYEFLKECEIWKKQEVTNYAKCMINLQLKIPTCWNAKPQSERAGSYCREEWTNNPLKVDCSSGCKQIPDGETLDPSIPGYEDAEKWRKYKKYKNYDVSKDDALVVNVYLCTAESTGFWLSSVDCKVMRVSSD